LGFSAGFSAAFDLGFSAALVDFGFSAALDFGLSSALVALSSPSSLVSLAFLAEDLGLGAPFSGSFLDPG